MFIVIPGISLNRRLLNRDFTVFCVRGIRLSVQRLKELSVRQVTQELEERKYHWTCLHPPGDALQSPDLRTRRTSSVAGTIDCCEDLSKFNIPT